MAAAGTAAGADPDEFLAPAPRRRRRRGSPSAPAVTAAQSFDLSGTFTLYSTGYGYSTCGGSGGYSDITTGTAVTVYDAAGTVLSQGALGTGHSNGAGTCVFSLPDDARYGRVAISLGN
ncbi:hypothetical protein [Amycolatopsis lexingtonensis]|uniref:hypothetical protein n=1 Tax=Amycolatopsis lexingtonensis TaxID=218822 RepID=UPI003F6FD296